jgi:hypothetical protein
MRKKTEQLVREGRFEPKIGIKKAHGEVLISAERPTIRRFPCLPSGKAKLTT